MTRLTREQAAIVGLYTGVTCGPFEDVHELAEKVAGRQVWTHELGNAEFVNELQQKVKPQFLDICAEK